MFARAGWQVRFLGTQSYGTGALTFPPHPNIAAHHLNTHADRLRTQLRFLYFSFWVFAWCVRWRPSIVYASDLYAAPAAVLIRPFVKTVVYHEHDTPRRHSSVFQRWCFWSRSMIAR